MKIFYKAILFLFIYAFLNACVTNTNVNEKPVVQSPEAKVEKEKEDMMWAMPTWCENLKQEPFQIKACGIAKSSNLQTSRTRSALDARKQITKILNNQCNSSEREETVNGKSVFKSSYSCETGEVNIKNIIVKKRKTERVGLEFVTFSILSLSYR